MREICINVSGNVRRTSTQINVGSKSLKEIEDRFEQMPDNKTTHTHTSQYVDILRNYITMHQLK